MDRLRKFIAFDTNYVMKSGSWLMLGYFFTVLSILSTSYVFANYLSPTIYGEYKYLLTIGTVLSVFSFTGASVALTQGAARKIEGFFYRILRVNLLYSLIISLLAIIGAIYYIINGNATLAIGLVIIALLQPLLNNSSLIFSYFYGTQQFKINTLCYITRTLFVTIFTVGVVFLTSNVIYLFLTFLASNILINYIIQYVYAPKKSLVTETEEAANILRYGKHSSFQNIISGISNHFDKILIFQNLGAADLATYAFATALPDQYKALTKTVETMLLPRFTKQTDQSIRVGMVRKSIVYFIILFISSLTYILIAPYIFKVLYPTYEQSIFLSQIYALGILTAVGGIPLTGMQSQMSNRKLYKFNLYTSLFQVLSLAALLPAMGLMGAIVARVSYRIVVCFSAYYLYLKK